jgi:hypothetical protein
MIFLYSNFHGVNSLFCMYILYIQMTVKLSIEELKRIKELFREKKEKRKKKKAQKNAQKRAQKKNKIFPNEQQKFNGNLSSDNVVRYNFPNSGASVLARDFQNSLGDLNNRFNNLIKDKPEKTEEFQKKTEEFKSKYHEMANNLIDDVLDGKRNIRRNKEGSTTITDLIEKPKEISRPKMSRRKVEIISTPMPNDGVGDFSRVAFKPKVSDKNIRPTMNILSLKIYQTHNLKNLNLFQGVIILISVLIHLTVQTQSMACLMMAMTV